ncbi:hypothetical protein C8Q69DRAFT_473326 [Paecilomyces variotii]|uniref:Uncharacterized protein n=1 Tax=Byssochlamys spectabilis TaxID=264951 RepID=A0A443HR04_BYSSP|nr:hypothetical protein C8Q69DRAFT_473326 [Paecilomyces variotii]RWQ94263.1 hypothetical protein C8Q69DRAFT_473326 [Paecilomyces variotii]
MCKQSMTFYEWCQCQEDMGKTNCSARIRGRCPGIMTETVRLQCFCSRHATSSWVTEKKGRKEIIKTGRDKIARRWWSIWKSTMRRGLLGLH